MTDIKQIFIVGSSRSGTTMMGRILNNHESIFTYRELHFFETIWAGGKLKILSRKEQIFLLSKLLCTQDNGLFNQRNIESFNQRASEILGNKNFNILELYKLFLKTITKENKAIISCEQTPKNLYYLEEILLHFPDARIINMVRDQRDVLLSQKNKWKRKFLGASAIPFFEAFRSFINYHPLITSKIWASSLKQTFKYQSESRVMIVKFEDLLTTPNDTLSEICKFLNIKFKKEMLMIPVIGSSTEKDSKNKFSIDKSKINKWKVGDISAAEIYLSQKIAGSTLDYFSYPLKNFSFPPIGIIYYLLIFPLKLIFVFIFNFNRAANILQVIKKRFIN